MRRLIFALVLVVALPAALAAGEYMSLAPTMEPVSVRVLESGAGRTVLEYTVGGFERTPVVIGGKTYYAIGLGEEATLLDAGWPALPTVGRSIIIPDNAEMAVRVVESEWVEYAGLPVVPSKGNLLRTVDPASVPYEFGRVYSEGGVYPSEAAYGREPYIMRDYRGMVVVVNPFQYDAGREVLRVCSRMVVSVEGVGAGKANVLTHRPERLDAEFDRMYRGLFLNYESAKLRYTPVDEAGEMLVICYGDFMTAMGPFVEWKRQMGMPCEMVSVATAGGTSTAIKAYIQSYYNTHDLTYVLLVGDAAQCPSPTVSNLSDPSYSLLAGSDNRPEILVGRFSAENAAQVETQVLRTVEYEKRPQAGAAWYHKGTGVASTEGPGDDGEYDNVHIANIGTDLLGFTYTAVDGIYGTTATPAMVTTALNDGRSVIHYCGHGSSTSWVSSGFSNTHVNALVNDNMLPFIFSVACVNGLFGSTTCFAEAWLRATNDGNGEPTGAVGTYMSTINQSWNPPMDAEDEFADLLVGTSAYGIKRAFGGLCYNGSNHMMDVYGSAGESEFLHWTVFGDPSLKVRTDTPADVQVTHLPAIYPSMTAFDVTVTGVEGALCALYYDGVLYGSASTNASGLATVAIGTPPTAGTTLTLTVTAFNKMTYTADVPVQVPFSYEIDPTSIPVNVTSAVTVTVWDEEASPKPDVVITIDGWGIEAVVDTTDALGEAHFSLTPPYGEDLTVIGREIGESYDCVDDVLPVTGGVSFTTADIAAGVPLIGLVGSLTPYYEGEIEGTADVPGFDLYAVGCGVDAEANSGGNASVDLLVTPTAVGTVHAAIGKSGYNVYAEDIAVQVVYGTMSGEVYEASRAPIVGAKLKGYGAGADTTGLTPLFSAVSGVGGVYTITGDLAVGHYDVYASKFGYLTDGVDVFIGYGANDEDFYLESAPSGVVSGVVTETGTGTPLTATVKVYRSDTMELFAETSSSAGLGGAYEVEVPYFGYEFRVRAYHHIPVSVGVDVNEPTEAVDFELEPTLANILVLSDGVAKSGEVEREKVDRSGNVLAVFGGEFDGARSASQLSSDLVTLGYDVVEETAAASDPGTWLSYDFIVSASGDNTSPVASAAYRAALESYVASGGKLLA